ncbi:signal peptidase II [Thioalkalicoccus limnaeus]|uniref:Lipoprotein signal peptidase n=1 Tax=Thioalkalicoccus limnaeus TaxID=120681 RepID=A0ABV4BDG5_9GAMM
MARWLWLSLAVLVLDQITKVLALGWLTPYLPYPVIPNFNLTLMFNEGAAFSVLADAGGWQRWGLSAFAAGMSLVLAVWLTRLGSGERLLAVSLALIIGGAVGNLIDRVLYGHVIDFVQVYLPVIPLALFNPWPAFNIADSAISVGVMLLLFASFRADGTARTSSARD